MLDDDRRTPEDDYTIGSPCDPHECELKCFAHLPRDIFKEDNSKIH